ncbi:MAG: protein kinase [Thermoanaerobaculia bacterium]
MGLSVGTKLGPYEIVAPLGVGGMGEVYRATDTRLGREVALKVLPGDFLESEEGRTRFEREARALATLSHPNIAAVYAFEEIPGSPGSPSRHLLAMELLEGGTLREALAKGPLPLKKALDVGLQVAEGLAAAHGKGIVHRDIKPENVFVTKDGHVKILDFGLARHDVTRHDPADTRSPTLAAVSEKGVVLGTVAYMSPEQARGETVDFRSDQFSLGTVLYEMLTGKRPFVRDSAAQTMAAIIQDEPEPVTKLDPKLPAPVGWLVQRCLSKDKEERYSSTKDLAKELHNLRTHLSEAVSAANGALADEPRLRPRVPYWVLVLAAAVTLAVALGLYVGFRSSRTGPPPGSPLIVSLNFPVDAGPNVANPPALTPDGKTIVYVGLSYANQKIFVRRLDHDEIRPIPGTDGAWFPFLSPDGLEVGFFADRKLKKVALAGGSPVTLCDAPRSRGGNWGADGTIVFVPSATSGLWRIPASGGEPRKVTTPDAAKDERHYFPQFLPDGEHVLFAITDGRRTSRAAVVSLRTGEQRILIEDAAYPRYLPTGHLLFTRPGSLFAVPFSLSRLEVSGSPVPLLDDLVTNFSLSRHAEFAFSQEGTLVYVPALQLQRTLVWVDRKGAVERVPFPPGHYYSAGLSPDGGRLAVITAEKGGRRALLVGDLTRGTLSHSVAEGSIGFLVWAPDGKRIAFGFAPEGGELNHVFWQDADGSTPPERLTGQTTPRREDLWNSIAPDGFSPDGNLLLVDVINNAPDAADPGCHIFVLSLIGEKTLRPFLQTKFNEEGAHFSPDGRWVAYYSNDSGRHEVFVRPFPGPGPKWQISTEGGLFPLWSRSGRELFYRNGEKMMVVDVETKLTFRAGRPRALFEGRYIFGDSTYAVTPDGTRFLMIKEDPAESETTVGCVKNLKVILNWFEEVKRRVPGAK